MLRTFAKACALLDRSAYRRMLLLGALTLANAGLEVVGIGVVPGFIALVANPDDALGMPILRRIYDTVGLSSATMLITLCGVAFVLLLAVKNAVYLHTVHYGSRFVSGEAASMAQRLFFFYLASPYVVHLRRNSADAITTIDTTVDQVTQRALNGGISAATESLILLGIGIMLLAAEPLVTLPMVVILGGVFYLLFLLLQRRMAELGAQDIALRRQRLQCVQQSLGSLKEIKLLGREEFFLAVFSRLRRAHARLVVVTTTLQQAPRVVVETLTISGLVLIVISLLWQGRAGSSILGAIGLFTVAAIRTMPSLTRLVMALNNLRYGRQAVERVSSEYTEMRHLTDKPFDHKPLPPLRESIELRGVSFSYPGQDRNAVENISLSVRRGESIGIVGPSGAGKSTLVDLLLGLLTPDGGEIAVDGRNIASNSRGWQDQLGYVPQTIVLLDDSIRRNIALGVPDAEIDEDALWQALRFARLDDFVASLPNGLDTSVGERGVRLSGGQRQRIGIARALYHEPDIIIMDEATSALDSETESEIARAMDALHGRKTLIIIAHRLSTLRGCDRLVMLDGGRIVDTGSFADLAARSPQFYRMTEFAGIGSFSSAPEVNVSGSL